VRHDSTSVKDALRWSLTALMVASGINHFAMADTYVAMMPDALPWHRALVYISGVAEVAGGLGLVLRSTRRAAAWGLVALLVAVFPANVNMAVHHLPLGDREVPAWALWARLPLQAVLIAWAFWYTRPDRPRARG
jgi:uncharacterized membrane protein